MCNNIYVIIKCNNNYLSIYIQYIYCIYSKTPSSFLEHWMLETVDSLNKYVSLVFTPMKMTVLAFSLSQCLSSGVVPGLPTGPAPLTGPRTLCRHTPACGPCSLHQLQSHKEDSLKCKKH